MKTNLSNHSYWPGGVAAALLAFALAPVFAGPNNNSNPEQNAAMNTSAAAMPADGSVSKSDRHFLMKAYSGSDKEVALAQLATARASDPQVRQYAMTLSTDHQLMQSDLHVLASQKGVTLRDGNMKAMAEPSSPATSAGSLATYQDRNAPNASGDHSMGANTGTGSQIGSADHTKMDRELAARGSKAFTSQPDAAPTTAVSSGWNNDRDFQKLSKEMGSDFDRDYVKLMVEDHEADVHEFQKEAQSADNADVRAFASKQLATLQSHLNRARTLAASMK